MLVKWWDLSETLRPVGVEQINYFPQDPNQNSFFGNPRDWFNMETEWKRTLSPPQNSNIAPQSVQVDIQPQFQGNSKRPTGFIVTETIGTNAPFTRPTIPNP